MLSFVITLNYINFLPVCEVFDKEIWFNWLCFTVFIKWNKIELFRLPIVISFYPSVALGINFFNINLTIIFYYQKDVDNEL